VQKVLITGGAGFIGSALAAKLQRDGKNVTVIDDLSIGKNIVIGVKYIYDHICNITDYDLSGYDTCFHLAGLSRIQPSFKNPLRTIYTNTFGTASVLNWAKENKVKVIYAGSSSFHHDPYQSPYATSKYLGEEICKMYSHTYNMEVQVARFYNVYGPGELVDGKWAAVIGIFRNQIEKGLPITIVGDGEQRRDFTHVQDIISGLILIADATYSDMRIWELGTGANYSINEIYNLFKKKFPHITKLRIDDQKGNYRETRRVNNDAIVNLGWEPQDRMQEYIESL
jgi:UDP-glucose 4-epimerase